MRHMNAITLSDFELSRVFFAIVVLLGFAHGCGYFFQRLLGFPKVIGEIAGGLLLGPTVLGFFLPSASQWIFQAFASEGQLIALLSWIGLVFLMFISGFEIQRSISREDKKLIVAMLCGATILPFLVGWFAPRFYDFSPYMGAKSNMLSFTIILGVAIAVTSIPVIAKIFMDLGIIKTRFAKIILATATIEDVLLWIALALATAVVGRGTLSVWDIATNVLLTCAFFALALLAMPKLFEWANRSGFNLLIRSSATGYVLIVCFLFAAVASILRINVIFGAFLAGVVVGMTSNEKITSVKIHVQEIALGFFIPLYFAVVGLKLDLIHHFDVSFFLLFLLFAVGIKMLGTVVAAKWTRQSWLSSFNLGVAMNARGGPGIVLATVAFDLGIINETFFAILVLVAIVTSLLAGYWLRLVVSRGWELLGGP